MVTDFARSLREQTRLGLASAAIGALAGSASAALLVSLDWVTERRLENPWLISVLPLAGFAIGWTYRWFGRRRGGRAIRGTDLIIEEIHRPTATAIPLPMAPLVFFGTLVTHAFGGSAGREGTAVQMAASIGDRVASRLAPRSEAIPGHERRLLLMASLAAGFGSVFGVPFAGAVFGLEAPRRGRVRWAAIFPCCVASEVGHLTTMGLGVRHAHYLSGPMPHFSFEVLIGVILAGVAFGALARAFVGSVHATADSFARWIRSPPVRPMVGGALIALTAWLLRTDRPLGLGLPQISESFQGLVPTSDFAFKFVFTVATVGSGFKGGEVTPLFYMGATGGNALSRVLPLPSGFLAALGFVAVFAGAANVPLTCSVMAMELFGFDIGG